MNNSKVGETINYLRKRAGYTQKDLADRIGISDKAVSKWERGIALPDLSYISKLAVLLDTDTDSLLAGSMLPHGREWAGLLLLPTNEHGIDVATEVYGKPMVYFLLGYYLLMGIREIWVSCDTNEREIIERLVGSGDQLGIKVRFISEDRKEAWSQIKATKHSNFMIVFGRHFLYGVDQTKFFQRAMAHKDHITVLSLPKQKQNNKLFYNSNGMIVEPDSEEKVRAAYHYGQIPILFCPKDKLYFVLEGTQVGSLGLNMDSRWYNAKELCTETLDRGYVDMPMNTLDEVADVSNFVRIVQHACGMELYCIEEIAWRRGLISIEQLKAAGDKVPNTPHGKYLLELYRNYQT